jgi:hypothetical protein
MIEGLNRAVEILKAQRGLVGGIATDAVHEHLNILEHALEKAINDAMAKYRAPGTCECGGHIGCCGTQGG